MPEQKLWVESYRPKEIDDIVMTDETKDFFKKCINDENIPHLLFSGPPGSGKTTTARILCDKIIHDEGDILRMNGSNTTGVDSVRNTIEGFLKSPAFSSKLKIVFIDEADYLSSNAQAALRNIMEEYYETSRMIFTCNYVSKIIDPLQSRFQSFRFERLSEVFITDFCSNILEKENIKFTKKMIQSVVKSLSPDVRKIINTLQRHVLNGEIKGIDSDSIASTEKKIIGLIIELCDHIGKNDEVRIVNKNITNIQTLLNSDVEPDYRFIYDELFKSKIPAWGKIKLNHYANNHQSCAIPSIHFQALVLDILMAGKEYIQIFGEKNT